MCSYIDLGDGRCSKLRYDIDKCEEEPLLYKCEYDRHKRVHDDLPEKILLEHYQVEI